MAHATTAGGDSVANGMSRLDALIGARPATPRVRVTVTSQFTTRFGNGVDVKPGDVEAFLRRQLGEVPGLRGRLEEYLVVFVLRFLLIVAWALEKTCTFFGWHPHRAKASTRPPAPTNININNNDAILTSTAPQLPTTAQPTFIPLNGISHSNDEFNNNNAATAHEDFGESVVDQDEIALNLSRNPAGLHSHDALIQQPLWAYKQKKFWQCGRSSIWRTWIMYLWYVSLIFVAVQLYRIQYSNSAQSLRLSTLHNTHQQVDHQDVPSPWSASLKYLALYGGWSKPEYYDEANRFMSEKFEVVHDNMGQAKEVQTRADNILEDLYYRENLLPGATEPEYFAV